MDGELSSGKKKENFSRYEDGWKNGEFSRGVGVDGKISLCLNFY